MWLTCDQDKGTGLEEDQEETGLYSVEDGDDSDPLPQWLTEVTSLFPFKSFYVWAESSEVVLGGPQIAGILNKRQLSFTSTFVSTDFESCEQWDPIQ